MKNEIDAVLAQSNQDAHETATQHNAVIGDWNALSANARVNAKIDAMQWLAPDYQRLANLSRQLSLEFATGANMAKINDILHQMSQKHAQCTVRLNAILENVQRPKY